MNWLAEHKRIPDRVGVQTDGGRIRKEEDAWTRVPLQDFGPESPSFLIQTPNVCPPTRSGILFCSTDQFTNRQIIKFWDFPCNQKEVKNALIFQVELKLGYTQTFGWPGKINMNEKKISSKRWKYTNFWFDWKKWNWGENSSKRKICFTGILI